jgi:hypothetical protein
MKYSFRTKNPVLLNKIGLLNSTGKCLIRDGDAPFDIIYKMISRVNKTGTYLSTEKLEDGIWIKKINPIKMTASWNNRRK